MTQRHCVNTNLACDMALSASYKLRLYPKGRKKVVDASNEAIGKRIAAAREALGLNQGELGALCGWRDAQSRVSRYENGNREMKLADLVTLADKLGVDPEFLTFGSRQENPYERALVQCYRSAFPPEKTAITTFCESIKMVTNAKRKAK